MSSARLFAHSSPLHPKSVLTNARVLAASSARPLAAVLDNLIPPTTPPTTPLPKAATKLPATKTHNNQAHRTQPDLSSNNGTAPLPLTRSTTSSPF